MYIILILGSAGNPSFPGKRVSLGRTACSRVCVCVCVCPASTVLGCTVGGTYSEHLLCTWYLISGNHAHKVFSVQIIASCLGRVVAAEGLAGFQRKRWRQRSVRRGPVSVCGVFVVVAFSSSGLGAPPLDPKLPPSKQKTRYTQIVWADSSSQDLSIRRARRQAQAKENSC
jgi:hypothetical protein